MAVNAMHRRPKCDSDLRHQKGVALVISLIILAICTLVGISSLSGIRLNERIVSNSQQKSTAFEAAESTIVSLWSVPTVMSTLKTLNASGADILKPVQLDSASDQLSVDLDQSSAQGSIVDINTIATFQYCGETNSPMGSSLSANESSVQIVGVLFNASAQSSIANSSTESKHVQRGYIIRPATGLNANCAIIQ